MKNSFLDPFSGNRGRRGLEENMRGTPPLKPEYIPLPQKSERTAPPQSEDTALPQSENTALPKSESTALPKSESTALPKSESTASPKSENTAPPKSEDIPSSKLEDASSQNESEDKDRFDMPKETINKKNVNELFNDTLPMTQSHELAVLFKFINDFNIKKGGMSV